MCFLNLTLIWKTCHSRDLHLIRAESFPVPGCLSFLFLVSPNVNISLLRWITSAWLHPWEITTSRNFWRVTNVYSKRRNISSFSLQYSFLYKTWNFLSKFNQVRHLCITSMVSKEPGNVRLWTILFMDSFESWYGFWYIQLEKNTDTSFIFWHHQHIWVLCSSWKFLWIKSRLVWILRRRFKGFSAPCPSLTEYSDRPLGLWVELHLRIKYNQPSIISSPLLTIICSLSTPSSPLASLIWIFPSLRQEIEFEQVAMTPTGHSWNWHKEPAGKIYSLKSLMSCIVLVPTKMMR